MKPKRRRMFFALFGLALLGSAAALALTALEDSVVFFYTPGQVAAKKIAPGQRIRLGGLVEAGSRNKLKDGVTQKFRVTDCKRSVTVMFRGVLPDLFREGQGVVAEGVLRPDGVFVANSVLAKHDENYMSKEVAAQLKKNGMWKKGEKHNRCPKA
jgi:cytochrome c-type biogenesis protein CcmE